MSGHPAFPVESRTDHLQGAALHLQSALRPEPRRPSGPRHRQDLQDGPQQVQRHCQGMDQQIRDLSRLSSTDSVVVTQLFF